MKNLNRDDEYLYSVDKVVVFGPYFEGAEKIKDIDVAVELSPKEPNPLKLEKLVRQQAEVSEGSREEVQELRRSARVGAQQSAVFSERQGPRGLVVRNHG